MQLLLPYTHELYMAYSFALDDEAYCMIRAVMYG